MSIARIRPVLPLDALDAAFDDLVRSLGSPSSSWLPPADVIVDGDDLVVVLELPGVHVADVDVELDGRRLTVKGHRGQVGGGGPARRELRSGQFTRSFRLPPSAGPHAVTASMDQGLLTIRVARALPQSEVTKVTVVQGPAPAPALEAESVPTE